MLAQSVSPRGPLNNVTCHETHEKQVIVCIIQKMVREMEEKEKSDQSSVTM